MEDSNNLTVSHSHSGLFYTAPQEDDKGEDAIQVEGAPNETSSQLVEGYEFRLREPLLMVLYTVVTLQKDCAFLKCLIHSLFNP